MKQFSYFCVTALLLFCYPLFAQNNTYTGTNAGNGSSGGAYNATYGYSAGDVVTGDYNSFFGAYAGLANTSGNYNTFIGYRAGDASVTASANTYVGYYAGNNSTAGSNTFLGYYSGFTNTTGTNNTYVGYHSGRSATGGNNTFIGYQTGNSSVGTGNVFLGYQAGYNESGSGKLYIDNSNTATPLIYGDFTTNQVGINAVPTGSYTLNIGGSLNLVTSGTAIYVNGVPYVGGASQWTTSGSNINFNLGVVSIGTTAAPAGYKLAIGGKAVAEEITVKLQSNWPDYVFENAYTLLPLADLKCYIELHKHLPDVPAAREVTENGIAVGEMSAILLKKIEELTLHLIKQQEEIDALRKKINETK
ncbi:MAG: hypothetical protein JNK18_02880 [Cyclobacteriaceae bacterium]|nr:hypothetical protein [Cyclobacteriaceae bacterium]